MRWSEYVWDRLKAIPVGVWSVIVVGISLLSLYLRGRRLEAELAVERLKTVAAESAASTAKHEGRAEVHRQRANAHAKRAVAIASKVALVERQGDAAKKKISAMPADRVTQVYLASAARDKGEE